MGCIIRTIPKIRTVTGITIVQELLLSAKIMVTPLCKRRTLPLYRKTVSDSKRKRIFI